MPRQNQFRFKGKHIFLTYTHCDLSPEDFYLLIQLHLSEQNVDIASYTIGSELHEDGDRHIHAYLVFAERLETRRIDFFDLDHYPHPNIQSVGNSKKDRQNVDNYCRKVRFQLFF